MIFTDEATDLVEPADSTPKDADPGQSSSNEAVGFCSMEDSMHVADDVVGDKQHADSIAEGEPHTTWQYALSRKMDNTKGVSEKNVHMDRLTWLYNIILSLF